MKPKIHRHKRMAKPLIAIIIIIIVIGIIYFSISGNNVIVVSGNRNISLALMHGAYFKLSGNSTLLAIYLKNSSNNTSTFYIARTPILSGEIVVFNLTRGHSINVSTSLSQSGTADIEVMLLANTNSTAIIQLIPIPRSLALRQSGGIKLLSPYSLGSGGINSSGSSITTTQTTSNTPTNTVKQNTTTPPLPPPQNTTKNQGPSLQSIATIANGTKYGTLMVNYNVLYKKGTQCLPSVYNSTLIGVAHQQPVGPHTFQNVSATTPTYVNTTVTKVSGSTYYVNYTAVTPTTSLNKVSLSLTVNSSSSAVLNVLFKGIFLGSNYTTVNNAYNIQSGIYNNCAVYIP